MADKKQWSVDHYTVISVTQVSGMFAVYAYDHPTENGKFYLHKEPLHFVGIAKVRTSVMRTDSNGKTCSRISELENGTQVVGLDLSEGFFTVCDEACNFAGLMREGDDIDNVTGCLNTLEYPLVEYSPSVPVENN